MATSETIHRPPPRAAEATAISTRGTTASTVATSRSAVVQRSDSHASASPTTGPTIGRASPPIASSWLRYSLTSRSLLTASSTGSALLGGELQLAGGEPRGHGQRRGGRVPALLGPALAHRRPPVERLPGELADQLRRRALAGTRDRVVPVLELAPQPGPHQAELPGVEALAPGLDLVGVDRG